MPLTNEELRNNYWLSVIVYLCDYGAEAYTGTDPSTGDSWSFGLVDDGTPPHPNPQIATWGIEAKPQPTDEEMMESVDMSMIDAAFAAIYGEPAVKEKKERLARERRQLSLREAKLAREAAARLEMERAEAARAEAERLEAERLEAERAEAERAEAERLEAEEERSRTESAVLAGPPPKEAAGGPGPVGPDADPSGGPEEPEIKIYAAPPPEKSGILATAAFRPEEPQEIKGSGAAQLAAQPRERPAPRRSANLAPHPDAFSEFEDSLDGGGLLGDWNLIGS
jgi:hypothetical protein